jgi:hypothetical protein
MAPSSDVWLVPELGPSLGRLVDPAPAAPGALRVLLEDVRLDLVTGVFDLAGAARAFAAAGDHEGAVASLGRPEWLRLWETAVEMIATRVAAEANAGLRLAAAESRFPERRLRRLTLTEQDTRAIGARLGSGGAPFVAALDALEQAAHSTGGARAGRAADATAWQVALGAAARRLESAWIALDHAARAEQERWAADIAAVRAWRRPTWPVWLVTAIAVAAAAYLGLVLGGYLPVPPPLQPIATFWWSRP